MRILIVAALLALSSGTLTAQSRSSQLPCAPPRWCERLTLKDSTHAVTLPPLQENRRGCIGTFEVVTYPFMYTALGGISGMLISVIRGLVYVEKQNDKLAWAGAGVGLIVGIVAVSAAEKCPNPKPMDGATRPATR